MVTDAVERDLAALAKRDPALAEGAFAYAALSLAAQMDKPGVSATAVANCANALNTVLDRLWALAPAEESHDRLDDLAARRANRRATA